MRILIAPDKFKGSLSAGRAARSIERALVTAYPHLTGATDLCPIADGGEGTAEAMITALGGQWVIADVTDAQGRPVQASYGWIASRKEAVMEMSAASGLALVSDLPLRPETASTFGTGLLIADAIRRGAERIVIGIGGSATNDGGIGMARALGFAFRGRDGRRLESNLDSILQLAHIEAPDDVFPEILVACDVDNPLLEERGATAVYGPQKGVKEAPWFENRLRHLADVAVRDFGFDPRDTPGAGAAGGLGFGLMVFCGARLTSGFDLIAAQIGLADRIAAADLVITGEGRIDAQTLHGKGPCGVARMARAAGKPVAGIGGSVEDSPAVRAEFDLAFGIKPAAMPLAEAMARAEELLAGAVAGRAGAITALAAHPRRF